MVTPRILLKRALLVAGFTAISGMVFAQAASFSADYVGHNTHWNGTNWVSNGAGYGTIVGTSPTTGDFTVYATSNSSGANQVVTATPVMNTTVGGTVSATTFVGYTGSFGNVNATGTITGTLVAASTTMANTGSFGNVNATGYISATAIYANGVLMAGGTGLQVGTFTNQTGVSQNTTISSNALTLSGFSGTITAVCGSGCTAIARNGAWGGTTVAGFVAGDTIAIRQTSSATQNTTTTALVTVGGVQFTTWSVTTNNTTPNAFSFTDQTGLPVTGWTATSNAVTLSGFTGTLTASCNAGCTGIARNGTWGGTTVTGFVSGNTITIRQVASSSANTATTASVTVGATQSSPWTVTTENGSDANCPGVTTPGTACSNGMIFIGYSLETGNPHLYTTPCDIGQTYSGGTCTGTRVTKTWNNGSGATVSTGYTDSNTGNVNTAGLLTLSNPDSPYNAAAYCDALSFGGFDDWYLPAKNELATMYTNRAAIGNFLLDGSWYWSSSEFNTNIAWYQRFSDGYQGGNGKYYAYYVRCVRRD